MKQAFQPKQIMATLGAGLLIGALDVFVEISFAAFIFSGELASMLSYGIGLLLFGAVVIGVVTVFTSRLATAISVPQDSPIAILGLVAAGIAASMPATASEDALYFTVLAAIVVTSLSTAIFFLLMGRFKLGSLIRFIPYPVFGGFLAGTGWLLVVGGIEVMSGLGLEWANLAGLFSAETAIKWLPGFVAAVIMLLVVRRTGKFQHLLLFMVFGISAFYLVMFAMGSTVAEATDSGWLLGTFPQGSLWRPITPGEFDLIDWAAIVPQIGNMASVLLISSIGLLLNASAMELTFHQDVDLNRELQSSGWANLAGGLGGSPPGFHALSLSTLGYHIAGNRWVGLVSAAVTGLAFFFGATILSLFPKLVLGGLLLFIGFAFLAEWLYDSWGKLPRLEYFLVVIILVIVGTFGFLQGVAAGIFFSVILFVINYSQVDVIKHVLDGTSYHSNVDRAVHHRRLLNERGQQMHIVKLQGFIFFGTAARVHEHVFERVSDSEAMPLSALVLDFRLVNRLDSSAINSFVKIKQLADANHFTMALTHLSPALKPYFETAEFSTGPGKKLRMFPDLDHGVEWCESQLLNLSGATLMETRQSLPVLLKKAFPDEVDFGGLVEYMEKVDVSAGEHLIHQDAANDKVFFVESGLITVQVEDEEVGVVRLRTMGPGTIVGELSFYLGMPTSASVVAERDTTLFMLTRDGLARLERDEPKMAAAFNKLVTMLLGERLLNTTQTLRALLD